MVEGHGFDVKPAFSKPTPMLACTKRLIKPDDRFLLCVSFSCGSLLGHNRFVAAAGSSVGTLSSTAKTGLQDKSAGSPVMRGHHSAREMPQSGASVPSKFFRLEPTSGVNEFSCCRNNPFDRYVLRVMNRLSGRKTN